MKRRVSCEIIVGGSRHTGVVLNLSPGGFFIQTGASPALGMKIDIELRRRDGEILELEATVANKRVVPRTLISAARGGIGCKLATPPEAYYQLLGSLAPA